MADRPVSLQDLIKRRQAGGFIGRQAELGEFQANLQRSPEDLGRRFLFSVHGDAGVGKSFLVRQFIRLAQEKGCLTAYVDESTFDIPTVMERIAADLAQAGKPCKAFAKRSADYRSHRRDLDADPQAPEGLSSALTRSAVRIGVRAAGDIPVVGAFVKEIDTDAVAKQADRFRVFLSRKLRDHHDVQLMLSPVEELTPTFVDDLRTIAAAQPVALFFDTYERTSAFLDQWLVDLFGGRYGALPPNLLITIAGQHPLDVNVWGDYLSIRTDMALQVFTETEARELLASRGVNDNAVVDVILGLTGRLPVLVAMLAEARPTSADMVGDPSNNAVERFLKWENDEQLKAAALHGALPRRLDRETYTAATGSTTVDKDFAWLCRLPFVSEHSDGYRYHDVVRTTMIRVQRRRSPADWRRHSTSLAEYYENACAALGLDDRARWKDGGWQGLAIEQHYHRLCAEPAGALDAMFTALVDTIDRNPEVVPRWLTMIRQAGRDTDSTKLSELAGLLEPLWGDADQGRLKIMTYILANAHLDDFHKATLFGERGNIHSEHERPDEALAEFDRAVALDPDRAWLYGTRGEAYRVKSDYERSLADLTKAIELDPEYPWALAERAWTYQMLQRYDEAIADLDRALELEPEYHWAKGERGETYNLMGRLDKALADLTEAVEAEPGLIYWRLIRARVLRRLGRFAEALAELDRLVTQDTDNSWLFAQRGEEFRLMDRYEEAVADFTRSLSLAPGNAWTLGSRGQAYRQLKRYDEALADLDSAIEFGPDLPWAFVERGRLHNDSNRFDQAIVDFTRALELDPDYTWALYYRGWTSYLTDRYPDAVSDLSRCLRVDPGYRLALVARGDTYRRLGRHEEALEDLNRAVELDPDDTWARGHRGQLLRVMGDYPAALEDLLVSTDDDSSGWQHYELALAAHQSGRADLFPVHFDLALRADRAKIAEFPSDGVYSLNVAVYLLAAGDRDQAVRQVRDALTHDLYTSYLRDALSDFEDVQAVLGYDASEPIALVQARLDAAGDNEISPA